MVNFIKLLNVRQKEMGRLDNTGKWGILSRGSSVSKVRKLHGLFREL